MRSNTSYDTPPEPIAWYALEHAEVCEVLNVIPEIGLTDAEAARRLEEVGPNRIASPRRKDFLAAIPEQVASPLILLLLAASLASFLMNRSLEGALLLAVAVIDVLPGLYQELVAARSGPGYRPTVARFSRVRRNRQMRLISATDLVPGDVIHLVAGDIVPADARLIASVNFRAQEAPLTGDKHTVDKVPQAIRRNAIPLPERHNLVFAGTTIVHGRGDAVVVQTGGSTELGRMAGISQSLGSRQTPLAGRLAQVNNLIAACLLGAFAVTLGIGSIRALDPAAILHGWSAMAVALIPEALPLLVLIVLVDARHRLNRRNTLVRERQALETLGAVTVVCSDQSGPLTQDQLRVVIQDIGGRSLDGHEPLRKGRPLLVEDETQPEIAWPAHSLILAIGALSAHANLQRDEDVPEEHVASGDPSEGAVLVMAARMGLWKPRLDKLFFHLLEAPFSVERGRQSALYEVRLTPHIQEAEQPLVSLLGRRSPYFVTCTGDPTSVLQACTRILVDGRAVPLTTERLAEATSTISSLEKQGIRVMGISYRPLNRLPALVEDYPIYAQGMSIHLRELPLSPGDTPRDVEASYELERELIFAGLVGIQEEVRDEAIPAVLACRKAGIRPILFSTAAPDYARQIAHRLRISAGAAPSVLTGQELDRLSGYELERTVSSVSVFSQIAPRHRVRIIQALQRQGQVVAVTGEEEDDAPALSGSDVGAALATRERQGALPDADLVLLDGSFATLIGAVEEGRQVYERIRHFLRFSLGRSIGLLLVLLFAPLFGMHASLTPLQVLLLNLAGDALIGLALTTGAARSEDLRAAGLAPGDGLLGRSLGRSILWSALGFGLVTGGFGLWASLAHPASWQTMLFSAAIFTQAWLGVYLSLRPGSSPDRRRAGNTLLGCAILIVLLCLALFWPALRALLELSPLSLIQLVQAFAFSALIVGWQLIPNLRPRKQ